MNNYIKILLIVIFFPSCSSLNKQNHDFNHIETICLNQSLLNKNYIGMTKEEIIYLFDNPVLSDSFQDVYHYCFVNKKFGKSFQKKMLNLYFKDNKVIRFNFT
ncbi:outer membrane protein assembly factor BamE [Buchnera aphidicola]|uniref:Outer membrane protein assembly factor BamE n=1 Tax=Buchnera aphidicola (Lipaphis pseudobrassicae) TaxID=1258543 RepID=A0A4D6YBZ8_9GAMM|nr:outer membrane protein assembly factor BamE [Buchnera aphidicola]QCI22065.1 outer membrane protein assembly factor BamE [Buchnera aphidicola (Lipaphis pseudobrassicae)]